MGIQRDELDLREITGDASLLAQVYALRVLAWRTQVALPPDMLHWQDSVDEGARHWAFTHQGQVIAAVRLSLHDSIADLPHPEVYAGLFPRPVHGPLAYYSRAVVHPAFRKLGLFTSTHSLCVEAAIQMGAVAMIGVSGSVDANRFTQSVFLAEGYQLVGTGQPYRATPYEATHAPLVFMRRLGGAITDAANQRLGVPA